MKKSLKTLLLLLVIAGAFLLFTRLFGDSVISVEFGEEALTLTAPQQFSHTVDYDSIESLELVELADPGTPVSGGENRRYSWGVWENGRWGRYTLCVANKIDAALLVTTRGGELLVFNYESGDTTRALLDMFTQLLENR